MYLFHVPCHAPFFFFGAHKTRSSFSMYLFYVSFLCMFLFWGAQKTRSSFFSMYLFNIYFLCTLLCTFLSSFISLGAHKTWPAFPVHVAFLCVFLCILLFFPHKTLILFFLCTFLFPSSSFIWGLIKQEPWRQCVRAWQRWWVWSMEGVLAKEVADRCCLIVIGPHKWIHCQILCEKKGNRNCKTIKMIRWKSSLPPSSLPAGRPAKTCF